MEVARLVALAALSAAAVFRPAVFRSDNGFPTGKIVAVNSSAAAFRRDEPAWPGCSGSPRSVGDLPSQPVPPGPGGLTGNHRS